MDRRLLSSRLQESGAHAACTGNASTIVCTDASLASRMALARSRFHFLQPLTGRRWRDLQLSQIMKIFWGQELGKPECPYIQRWVLDFGPFSIRLHHWLTSDDQRHFHDHPWWYLSLVLKGSYIDRNPKGVNNRTVGSLQFFPATHQHTVSVAKGGCWTLLVTGRERRQWVSIDNHHTIRERGGKARRRQSKSRSGS